MIIHAPAVTVVTFIFLAAAALYAVVWIGKTLGEMARDLRYDGLVDHASLLREIGIEFLTEARRTSRGVCRVCGAPMGRPGIVFCRRCRTPHHEECWRYNGRCSTYACGEKRARDPSSNAA